MSKSQVLNNYLVTDTKDPETRCFQDLVQQSCVKALSIAQREDATLARPALRVLDNWLKLHSPAAPQDKSAPHAYHTLATVMGISRMPGTLRSTVCALRLTGFSQRPLG